MLVDRLRGLVLLTPWVNSTRAINGGSCKIRIVLSTVMLALLGLLSNPMPPTRAVEPATTNSPNSARKVLLVLGDSLAAGYGLEPSEAFPALLQEKIDAAGLDWKVVNAGQSGDTSAGGLRRLDWLLKQHIDLLLLELGGNDGLRGLQPSSTKANLQAIIDRTRQKYPHAQIVIAGMRMPPNFGAEFVDQFQKLFPSLAKENHAGLVPFLLEGVGGEKSLNQADLIHPTPKGQEMVAENVWHVIRPLLETRPGGPDRAAHSR